LTPLEAILVVDVPAVKESDAFALFGEDPLPPPVPGGGETLGADRTAGEARCQGSRALIVEKSDRVVEIIEENVGHACQGVSLVDEGIKNGLHD